MDKVIEKIQSYVKEEVEKDKENDWPLQKINMVYAGDPWWIAHSNMPCIIIALNSIWLNIRGTQDELNGEIRISLVLNIKDFYWDDDESKIGYHQTAIKMIGWYWPNKKVSNWLIGILRSDGLREKIKDDIDVSGNQTFTVNQPMRVRDTEREGSQAFTYEPTININFISIRRR